MTWRHCMPWCSNTLTAGPDRAPAPALRATAGRGHRTGRTIFGEALSHLDGFVIDASVCCAPEAESVSPSVRDGVREICRTESVLSSGGRHASHRGVRLSRCAPAHATTGGACARRGGAETDSGGGGGGCLWSAAVDLCVESEEARHLQQADSQK
jgi:hypothetical protein